MIFDNENFSKPIYGENEVELKKLILISCEGSSTEPQYFEALQNQLGRYIPSIINVQIVPKKAGPSEPKHVLKNLENHITNNLDIDFNPSVDEAWMICDIEKTEARKKSVIKILDEIKDKNIKIALTNPLFELWLLMHLFLTD